MKLDALVGVTGQVTTILNGVEVSTHNLVLQLGKNWIANRVAGAGAGGGTHIAVGTGVRAPDVGDTSLQAEIARKVITTPNGVANANTITYETTFNENEGNGPLTEAMLTTAASGGTPIARVVFGVITKTDTDLLTVRWVLTIN